MVKPSAAIGRERLDLLDPREMSRLGGIELVTQGIVEGFLSGLHRSPRRGFSVEFAEHRAYQMGDELRYVDWKLLARTDRLYVKQYEEETNLRAMLVLDTSRSMDWTGDAEARLTKLAYSRLLTASLGLILLRQRDATGLITFDDTIRHVVPPRARLAHWRQILATLAKAKPGVHTEAEPALRRVVGHLRRRGLVVFVSDLLIDRELTIKALRFLRHRGHQVLVLHILDPAERSLEGAVEVRYRDPESGETVVLRPQEWATAYDRTLKEAMSGWRMGLRRHDISYEVITTDTPFGIALRQALVQATSVA